jgi:ribosome-associated toxin RatA of RatAB toxin-antitoxin module
MLISPPEMSTPFTPEQVIAAGAPLVAVHVDGAGLPIGATAAARVAAPPERVWAVVSDVASYAAHIPMISKVKREGDRVAVHLKFRISLFSVGFDFTADGTYQEGKWLELRWVSGEPRELRIRFDLAPVEAATVVHVMCGFDLNSLGWLVKYFLKHHPEIQFGIFPGSALTLLESMKKAVETQKLPG